VQRRRKLGRSFYARDALAVSPELLGKLLVRKLPDGERVCRIVEVEAYIGPDDQASHARRGPTPRAKIMFGPPGFAYVFLIYGMHNCLNFVVDREGQPSAILVRAAEPVSGLGASRLDGPGKLCKALAIDRGLNGADLVRGGELFLADDGSASPEIARSPRIGIDYAGPVWARKPWRYFAPTSGHVSRAPRPKHG
jgi:DNA-3-methyladenine glycosylase